VEEEQVHAIGSRHDRVDGAGRNMARRVEHLRNSRRDATRPRSL
jgi:hypothetical protein